ncbi:MAG: 2-amino-4-hydroxy-6-hydroxymethyldihydropteridine diphosphokinase [Pseudomonadota bacterium]
MVSVYIAVGSNIEPEQNMALSLEHLRTVPGLTLTQESSWYKTRPWGVENQDYFLNLVVGGKTELSHRELLKATQHIENTLGRKRILKNGPRTIDLDLLLYSDQIINEPDLVIPHAALLERDFMLVPLIEIAPSVVHPKLQAPVKELTDLIRYHQILDIVRPPSTQREGKNA